MGQGRMATALQMPIPSTPGQEVGGDTRAELADPAATSLGDSAVEGWCFGVLAGDLGAIHRTHWQRWETWA